MGWVLLKQCNNREEAVTEGFFPWEFIKPVHADIVLSSHKRGQRDTEMQRNLPTQCYQLVYSGASQDVRPKRNFELWLHQGSS